MLLQGFLTSSIVPFSRRNGRGCYHVSPCKRCEEEGVMHYRKLGSTGLEVSEVGYGAWGIGKDDWLGAEDDESVQALHKAIDLGLNFIDTALAYGDGHSESLVGRVVRERDWLEAVDELKSEGKIRFLGVSINDHQPENAVRLIETGMVDTVQVIYNVFDQSPEDELLPLCQERGVGVIVRVPFDEGALTARITPETEFEEGDFRNEYFKDDRTREVYERAQSIARDLGVEEERLPEVALRYVLSHPAISTVIPGMRSVRNVERNMAVADGEGLSKKQVQKLKSHRWVRNFYPMEA